MFCVCPRVGPSCTGGGGGSDVTGDKLAPLGDQFGTHRLCWRKLETASLRIMTGVCGPTEVVCRAAARFRPTPPARTARHRRRPASAATATDGGRHRGQAVARRCRAMDHKILLTRAEENDNSIEWDLILGCKLKCSPVVFCSKVVFKIRIAGRSRALRLGTPLCIIYINCD